MKKVLLSIMMSLSSAYSGEQFNCNQTANLKTFFDGALSGFYHGSNRVTPQACVAHDYNSADFPRSILSMTKNTPDVLWNFLQRILGVHSVKPDTFQVSIQRSNIHGSTDTGNLRPHYILFRDALLGNETINNHYNQAIGIDRAEIIPIRQTRLRLTGIEQNISAHPTNEDNSGMTILSGDSFKLEEQGANESQWFFSYFNTTTGEQLITLHAILKPDEQRMIDNHLARIIDENLPQNINDFFNAINESLALNDQPEYAALKDLVIKGDLSIGLNQILEDAATTAERERERIGMTQYLVKHIPNALDELKQNLETKEFDKSNWHYQDFLNKTDFFKGFIQSILSINSNIINNQIFSDLLYELNINIQK